MPHRRTLPDSRIDDIAPRVAAVIVAELERSGLPLSWEQYGRLLAPAGPVFTILQRLELAQLAAEHRTLDQRRAAWATESGAYLWTDLQAKLALSAPEMHTAQRLGLIRIVEAPSDLWEPAVEALSPQWGASTETRRRSFEGEGAEAGLGATPRYYQAIISAEDRQRVYDATQLSRTEAAARLGITLPAFDRLRKERGLRAAAYAPTRAGHMMMMFRQLDVDALTDSRPRAIVGAGN